MTFTPHIYSRLHYLVPGICVILGSVHDRLYLECQGYWPLDIVRLRSTGISVDRGKKCKSRRQQQQWGRERWAAVISFVWTTHQSIPHQACTWLYLITLSTNAALDLPTLLPYSFILIKPSHTNVILYVSPTPYHSTAALNYTQFSSHRCKNINVIPNYTSTHILQHSSKAHWM